MEAFDLAAKSPILAAQRSRTDTRMAAGRVLSRPRTSAVLPGPLGRSLGNEAR